MSAPKTVTQPTTSIRNIMLSLAALGAFSLIAAAQAPAGSSAMGNAAPASTGPVPSKIGVINIQGAIVNTNEGKRDFEALTKKFEPTQTRLKTLNDEIDNDKKQLQAQQDKLNDEERAKRVRDIETKQKNLQRQLDDAQTDFQQQQSELGNRIAGKMIEIIDKYARQNNLAMIVDVSGQQSPILWAAEQVNITPAIVEAYNAASGVAAPPTSNAPSAVKPTGTTARPAGTPAKKPATTTPPKQ